MGEVRAMCDIVKISKGRKEAEVRWIGTRPKPCFVKEGRWLHV